MEEVDWHALSPVSEKSEEEDDCDGENSENDQENSNSSTVIILPDNEVEIINVEIESVKSVENFTKNSFIEFYEAVKVDLEKKKKNCGSNNEEFSENSTKSSERSPNFHFGTNIDENSPISSEESTKFYSKSTN